VATLINNIIMDKIIQYFCSQLKNSLVGYEVNGNPEKRMSTIRNCAYSMFLKLSNEQREILIKKIKEKK